MADNRRQYPDTDVVLPGIRRIQGADVAGALTIVNVALPGVASTEFSYTFPTGTKRFTLKMRGNSRLQVASTSGSSGTTYWKMGGGNYLDSTTLNVQAGGLTLYIQSPDVGDVLEILQWS